MSQIKNFPHQYNDLSKIRATAEQYAALQAGGADTTDDGEFGYALARARVYRFRDLNYDAPADEVARALEVRIAQESGKPQQSQGARTAAREMRRTLRALGWIDERGEMTEEGERILKTRQGSEDEQLMVQVSLMKVTVQDAEGRISHPLQILLQLIEDFRFPSRSGMELALVARDDTLSEYRRISRLAVLAPEERRQALGATEYQMANAVKILPAFLLQAGLVTQDGSGHYVTTTAGRALLKRTAEQGGVAFASPNSGGRAGNRQARRRLTSRPAAKRVEEIGQDRLLGMQNGAPLSPEEQAEARGLLMERTRRHQELVRKLARYGQDAEAFENPLAYDLLFVPRDPNLPAQLWEAKTIDGDAPAQVRNAVGQLHYYEHFHVRPHWADREVLKAAAFDEDPGEELVAYMSEQQCAAFVLEGDELRPLNARASVMLHQLGKS